MKLKDASAQRNRPKDGREYERLSEDRLDRQSGQNPSERRQLTVLVQRFHLCKQSNISPVRRRRGQHSRADRSVQWSAPLSSTSDSMIESIGGGCIALFRKSPIEPRRSSFTANAISCSGVRRISGVECCSSLEDTTKSATGLFAGKRRYSDEPLISYGRKDRKKQLFSYF